MSSDALLLNLDFSSVKTQKTGGKRKKNSQRKKDKPSRANADSDEQKSSASSKVREPGKSKVSVNHLEIERKKELSVKKNLQTNNVSESVGNRFKRRNLSSTTIPSDNSEPIDMKSMPVVQVSKSKNTLPWSNPNNHSIHPSRMANQHSKRESFTSERPLKIPINTNAPKPSSGEKKEKTSPDLQKTELLNAIVDDSISKPRNASSLESDKLFSDGGFIDLGLHPYLSQQLSQRFNIQKPTKIQKLVIPELLKIQEKQDMMICSETGSGKTLCYLLPLLHILSSERQGFDRASGTRALILAPTRELCLQIQEITRILSMTFSWIVSGTVMGGEKKKSEKARLRKGLTIVVATPGRLIDHLKNTECFNLENLEMIIFDEADRLLDLGFEKDLLEIMDILKTKKSASKFTNGKVRNILISATLTKRIEGLSSQVLNDPSYLTASENDGVLQLPETLQQGVLSVPYDSKFASLLAFLRWKWSSSENDLKVIVFTMTCQQVDFFSRVFEQANLIPHDACQIYKLHGNLTQIERTQIYLRFCSAKAGILFCTNVAARGLDLPEIDWIVQYDPPEDIADYVHRVGRTARRGRKGRAVLFLSTDTEVQFLELLRAKGIVIRDMDISSVLNLGKEAISPLTELVSNDPDFKELASSAYLSFVRGYSTFPRRLKSIFHVKNLHLGHVARSFLLKDPPSYIARAFINRTRAKEEIEMPGKVDRRRRYFEETTGNQTRKRIKPEALQGGNSLSEFAA